MSSCLNISYDCIDDWISNKSPFDYSSLNVLQLNINGINDLAKFDIVGELLQRLGSRIDVIVLGETKLKLERARLYNLEGYIGVFSCRADSSGGLAVFYRGDLDADVVENKELDGLHHIAIRLLSRGRPITCHAIYRPPNFEAARFLSELDRMMADSANGQECILLGDMNIPVNIETNNVTRAYIRLLSSYNLSVTNTCVTRSASNNVLDHVVCTNRFADNVVNETIYNDQSDHNWIASSFKATCSVVEQTLNKQIVDHQRLNGMFIESLAGLSQQNSANDKLSYVINSYNALKQQCSRTVTIRARVRGHCPWMTFNLWKLIQIKDRVLKNQRRNRNDQHLAALLAHVSKKLQQEKAATKRNYYNNILANSDQKSSWRVINDVLGKQQSRTQPKELRVNGREN